MKHITTAILLAAALLLSACGFHLRKGVELPADLGPMKVVAANRYSPLAEDLSLALERSGALQAQGDIGIASTTPADATAEPVRTATLNIRKERWGSLPAAIDARGRAQELTLRYAVEFDLLRADGSVLVPRQVVELARNYVTVPTYSMGTDSEQEILAKEMQRDMVAAILRRIQAALQATAPPVDAGTAPPAPTE